MSDQPIFYIFVNSDLNMSKGQQIAQIVHITQLITDDLVKQCYEINPIPKHCMAYMIWKRNPVSIVLKATGEQLTKLSKMDGCKGFIDSGNRIPDNSLTIVGFYPNNTMNEFVKEYKLF